MSDVASADTRSLWHTPGFSGRRARFEPGMAVATPLQAPEIPVFTPT